MIGERYSLDREIGRGGMGAVWLGRDEVLGRPVAIKRVGITPGGSSPDLLRADREARIAASLNHPHIVGVYDLVHDDDHQYLVMEYVEGVTLSELVRDGGPLPSHRAAQILTQVASALGAAHANGVVHRDVKPSNILVRDDGQVKLSDFGIARTQADASLTQTGLVTGSPAYLAPEVASGKQATPASDVWSLGATLFHALSGRPPYDVGDNVLGTLYQIVNEPPPRLENPGEMAPVLLATMAHDPRRRWTMDDVARVLDLLAASMPAAAAAAAPAPVGPEEPHTRTLHAVPEQTAPTAPIGPPATPVGSAATAASSRPRRRRAVLPVLVGLLVVALLGAIAALALMDDPQDTGVAPDASGTPEASSTSSPPSSEPTSASTSPTEEPPTVAEMESFIDDYLATASRDPAAGFEQLTPRYQAVSQGLSGYRGFWDTVANPRLLEFDADTEALTVSYTYRYTVVGSGPTEENIRLRLRRDGDGFLIDGEA